MNIKLETEQGLAYLAACPLFCPCFLRRWRLIFDGPGAMPRVFKTEKSFLAILYFVMDCENFSSEYKQF